MKINYKTTNNLKHNKLICRINQIMCILICIWMTLPYFRVKTGVLFLVTLFGIWIFTSDLKWLTKKWSMDLIFVLIFFITFIPYFITGNLKYGEVDPKAIIVSFPLFFVGIFVNHYYMYYKKDYNTLGKIALVSLIFYAVGSIQTYVGLLMYPTASRGLAGKAWVNPELVKLYTRLGIGGFGHVYAGCFLLIAALYLIIKKHTLMRRKDKFICILSFICLILMILKASYTISLMVVFSGIVLVLVVKNKKTFIFIMVLAAFFLLIFPQALIGEFFLKIADIFSNNYILSEKITDLAVNFLQESRSGQTGNRIDLYLTSFKTFFEQPLFGIYGPFGNPASGRIGGHSGWLDLLGFYGLFTGIPLFFTIYFNFSKHLKFYKKSNYYGFIIVIQFLFLVLGVINPVIYVYEIGFVLFCIVPAIPFLPYAFKKNILTQRRR